MVNQSAAPQSISLADLPVGGRARITGVQGDRDLTRRLMGLGLRVGSIIDVIQRRGRGSVVTSADTRIALGGSLTNKILIDRISSEAP